VKSRIQIRIKIELEKLLMLKMDQWGAVDAHIKTWRLKMLPWKISRPVVAYLHHFDKKQASDPDPDPH
jgi:hypothetical protein